MPGEPRTSSTFGRRLRQRSSTNAYYPNRTFGRTTTSATLVLATVVLVLTSSQSHHRAFAFAPRLRTHRLVRALTTYPRSATRAQQPKLVSSSNSTQTWSRNGSGTNSRFGVRKRVKAVLQKAKNRTGRDNFSERFNVDSEDGAKNVVADAASIGGLVEATDFVFSSTNGPSVNGAAFRNATEQLVPLETASSSASRSLSSMSSSSSPYSKRNKKEDKPQVNVNALLTGEQGVDPLPFTLPTLTDEQKQLLACGERIQEQSKMGREGSGYVVLDVKAPPYAVWECLLDFESYPEKIGTVRSMRMFTNTHLSSSYLAEKPILPGTGRETRHYGQASINRASFILSKFRLNIAAVHRYQPHPDGHYMVFSLDRACKNVVLKDAKGIWYTQSNPDGLGEDVTRVWLLCELSVSSLLPSMIVDYAAKRAMPRATTWLKPAVEEMERELHRIE